LLLPPKPTLENQYHKGVLRQALTPYSTVEHPHRLSLSYLFALID
jgi:hypothetical protein